MEQGSCLCGEIEYEVELISERTFHCHCQLCRKVHGAAFATLTLANAEMLNIKKGQDCLKEHKNGLGGFRAFCSSYGTRLMNYVPDKSVYLSIVFSTVDRPVDFQPIAHANVESKASWHESYSGIPSFQALPPGAIE